MLDGLCGPVLPQVHLCVQLVFEDVIASGNRFLGNRSKRAPQGSLHSLPPFWLSAGGGSQPQPHSQRLTVHGRAQLLQKALGFLLFFL